MISDRDVCSWPKWKKKEFDSFQADMEARVAYTIRTIELSPQASGYLERPVTVSTVCYSRTPHAYGMKCSFII